jgi:hypothetical protein
MNEYEANIRFHGFSVSIFSISALATCSQLTTQIHKRSHLYLRMTHLQAIISAAFAHRMASFLFQLYYPAQTSSHILLIP